MEQETEEGVAKHCNKSLRALNTEAGWSRHRTSDQKFTAMLSEVAPKLEKGTAPFSSGESWKEESFPRSISPLT